MNYDFDGITRYGKLVTGLTVEREALLIEAGVKITPHLADLTNELFQQLKTIPETASFIEGQVEMLKKAHGLWIARLFAGPIDENFTAQIFNVGDIQIKAKLPVEFMTGMMTLNNNHLFRLILETFSDDTEYGLQVLMAVNAVTGFSLLVILQSCQAFCQAEELEKFLKITGINQALFTNLASVYNDVCWR